MRSVRELDVAGRRVLVRSDLNVPLDGGRVADDTRIRASIPTVELLLDGGAQVVMCSHLGRPKGEPKPELSLQPVAERLTELLGREVAFGEEPGELRLLENLRFDAREEANDLGFAAELAAHRQLLDDPAAPFVVVIGGVKVADKIGVIDRLTQLADAVLIGGAMAFTFLAADGVGVGASRHEDDQGQATARAAVADARDRGCDLLLPRDVVVADRFDVEAATRVVPVEEIPEGWMGLDIGPQTAELYAARLAGARTIFWNGPMGVFELPPFAAGTLAVARAVADSPAVSVVGGGDSVAAVNVAGVADRISHVSTGGGAALELIEGRPLPGVEALTGSPV